LKIGANEKWRERREDPAKLFVRSRELVGFMTSTGGRS
jgi:hypothetical protein